MSYRQRIIECIKSSHPISTTQISEATGIPRKSVKECVANLMCLSIVQSDGKHRNCLYSPALPKPPQVVNRADPVCTSAMPNGSLDYWREHVRQMNTPARAINHGSR